MNGTLNEFELDILCLAKIWLCDSDSNVIRNALPKSHSIISVPRPAGHRTSGGVAII